MFVCCRSNKNDARSRIPEDINPWSAQRQFDMNLLKKLIPEGAVKGKSKVEQPRRAVKRADGFAVDTVDYFAVAQSYYKSYTFTYEGGDILTYDLGIAVDGTKVTFKNLLIYTILTRHIIPTLNTLFQELMTQKQRQSQFLRQPYLPMPLSWVR